MTSQLEKTDGPWDMKKLLDLLNASEELDAPEDALELPDAHEVRDAEHVARPEKIFVAENQLVSDHANHESMRGEVEDRFAAYIVDGMSKLMRE
jgi:hypothetical protein